MFDFTVIHWQMYLSRKPKGRANSIFCLNPRNLRFAFDRWLRNVRNQVPL